jgi:hypothetical protein
VGARLGWLNLFEGTGAARQQIGHDIEVQQHFSLEVAKWADNNPTARGKVVYDQIVALTEMSIAWGEAQGYLPPAVIRKESGEKVFSIDSGRTWKPFPAKTP